MYTYVYAYTYTYMCVYIYIPIYTHTYVLPLTTHLRLKDTHRLEVKGWKKIFYADDGKEKKKLG